MNRPPWLSRLLSQLDYGIGLKILARMPDWAAKWGVRLRGTINFVFDLEWRTLALNRSYVRNATYQSMCSLSGGIVSAWTATYRRYICASWEEYDASRLLEIDYNNLKWKETGFSKLLTCLASGKGAILITAHFDSLYIGLIILARQGVRVNVLSTKTVEDNRIPVDIRKYFSKKIENLSALIAPGKIVHFEDNLKYFIDGLKRGEVLIIAADGPATTSKRASAVNFLGKKYLMSSGPGFFAQKADVPICMYECKRDRDGNFDINISDPVLFEDEGLQKAYACLETSIRAEPWRWWAADLYQTYQEVISAQE